MESMNKPNTTLSKATTADSIKQPENIWQQIYHEAQSAAAEEPALAEFFNATILTHNSLGDALSNYLASKLASDKTQQAMLRTVMDRAFSTPDIISAVAADIAATVDRDSACTQYLTPFLYFKGFLALQAYRAAHQLWNEQRQSLALLVQYRISLIFAVDIHPAAVIGSGLLIDHATGLVIGETAVIEDCVSIMQSVTLGGTGKVSGDRHPKIRKGVLIGPGAKILGNIEVGEGAMVAASSVVLKAVPAHAVVAGVPAAVVGDTRCDEPSQAMDHYFKCD
ncbi:serine O-acetyltransferase [Porticoccaceae bacterium]|nr:serine O-acetyltransferase [Porticoccaceae bacterium]